MALRPCLAAGLPLSCAIACERTSAAQKVQEQQPETLKPVPRFFVNTNFFPVKDVVDFGLRKIYFGRVE